MSKDLLKNIFRDLPVHSTQQIHININAYTGLFSLAAVCVGAASSHCLCVLGSNACSILHSVKYNITYLFNTVPQWCCWLATYLCHRHTTCVNNI